MDKTGRFGGCQKVEQPEKQGFQLRRVIPKDVRNLCYKIGQKTGLVKDTPEEVIVENEPEYIIDRTNDETVKPKNFKPEDYLDTHGMKETENGFDFVAKIIQKEIQRIQKDGPKVTIERIHNQLKNGPVEAKMFAFFLIAPKSMILFTPYMYQKYLSPVIDRVSFSQLAAILAGKGDMTLHELLSSYKGPTTQKQKIDWDNDDSYSKKAGFVKKKKKTLTVAFKDVNLDQKLPTEDIGCDVTYDGGHQGLLKKDGKSDQVTFALADSISNEDPLVKFEVKDMHGVAYVGSVSIPRSMLLSAEPHKKYRMWVGLKKSTESNQYNGPLGVDDNGQPRALLELTVHQGFHTFSLPSKEDYEELLEEHVEPDKEVNKYGDLMEDYKAETIEQECLGKLEAEANAAELEKDVEWTTEGLRDYFNTIVETNQPTNGNQGSNEWVTKSQQSDFHFSMRKSRPDSSEVAFRMETYLPEDFKIHKVLPCIFDTDHLMKWDSNTDIQFKEDRGANYNLYSAYTRGKKIMGVAQRDFWEKGVRMWDGERFYNYSSAICHHDTEGKPQVSKALLPEGVVRSQGNYSVLTMERETKDEAHMGKIKVTVIQCFDTFNKAPAFVVEPALKSSMQKWKEGLSEYYSKNHESIC